MNKPVIAITLGDPAGIGPEVTLKSLNHPAILKACHPLIIGDSRLLLNVRSKHSFRMCSIGHVNQADFNGHQVHVLEVPYPGYIRKKKQDPNNKSGAYSYRTVVESVKLAMSGSVDGIVHGPISKEGWESAGIHYPGHTELIQELAGVKKVAMAIVSEPLRTVMVTRHIPLSEVSKNLKSRDLVDTITLAYQWMKAKGNRNPKIGICAFNPHAGEKGLIGNDELTKIRPAMAKVSSIIKKSISGPFPADSAYRDHLNGKFDCLVTMYHDQSLIPLKLFNSDKLVNITLGLPFPRTSPGHGTAYDIAGKNIANPGPMTEAIQTAVKLCAAKAH